MQEEYITIDLNELAKAACGPKKSEVTIMIAPFGSPEGTPEVPHKIYVEEYQPHDWAENGICRRCGKEG